MQVSVVLDSGECAHGTLAVEFGYSLYTDSHLHLPVGSVVRIVSSDASPDDSPDDSSAIGPLPEIPARQQVVSATQILSTRIYLLRPVSS